LVETNEQLITNIKKNVALSEKKDENIILFDGICNLCNGAINYVIQKDKQNIFKFATLQSEIGKNLLKKFDIDSDKVDSIVLIQEGKSYIKSDAALQIAKHLKGGIRFLYPFRILPKRFRDLIYDTVAKNRYKWFGKKESCMIPTPELQRKFLR